MPTSSIIRSHQGGSHVVSNQYSSTTESGNFQSYETKNDAEPEGDNGFFSVEKEFVERPIKINGERMYGATLSKAEDYVPLWYRSPSVPAHAPLVGRPTNGAAAANAGKRTNPSRPVVDIPAFVGELREIPRLLSLKGRNLLEIGASANLSYQFAWRPLISDLKDMADFARHAMRRSKELARLYDRGLRRTVDIWSDSTTVHTNRKVNSSFFLNVDMRETLTTKSEVRCHIRWKPTIRMYHSESDEVMLRLAYKAISGLGTNVSNLSASAWELIPFSWLIDYFTSIGDVLNTHRNTIPAYIESCSVIEETFTKASWTSPTAPNGFVVSDGVKVRQSYRREVAYPSISAYLPFLSNRQISILGSLAILRESVKYR